MLSNTAAGTVFLDANANGSRDGVGVASVTGVELGPRGSVILEDNDDRSTAAIPLGFSFEFYGRSFTEAYINNNGNLTFTSSLSRYSPEGFPQSTPIVAPFWADVDTRSELGSVHQSTGISPRGGRYFQADWVNVGYYNQQGDLRNDFSVYIEDDPAGDIVAFFYREMQWTTGSASSGDEGFGGTGAQIGFDSGNGTNFVSFGRPASADDLSFLNNAQFAFRVGAEGTPEPVQLESGIVGAVLYVDTNRNGQRDAGERFVETQADDPTTTTVNEAGRYRFEGLPTGTHHIRQELPPGFVTTSPASGYREISFSGDDEIAGGLDFGRQQVAALSGVVFEDSNRNGRIDSTDAFLPDVTVFLDTNNDGMRDLDEPVAVTSSSGEYLFERIAVGDHVVRTVAQAGNLPLNPSNGQRSVSLTAGETRRGMNFLFSTLVAPRIADVSPPPLAQISSGVSNITFRFDAPIDPAAHWGGLFELLAAGGDGQFDNGNEQIVPLTFQSWDPETMSLRLDTNGYLPRDIYRLTATDSLTDTTGNQLDGEFTGTFPSGNNDAGGAFVMEFSVTNAPPVAAPYAGRTSQLDALNVQLVANDSDGAVAAIRVVQEPQNGTLTPANGLGQFTYTPNPTFSGIERFQFVASDVLADGAIAEGRIVVAAAPVDLTPVSIVVPDATSIVMGQEVTASWTVRNLGPGVTVSDGSIDWTDQLYFSMDDQWDPSDLLLQSVPVDIAAVAPGEDYRMSTSVTLPFSEETGEAFLLIRTNSDGRQLELNDTNNTLALPVVVAPGIELLVPEGSFLGRNRAFLVEWRDSDQTGNALISIILDDDAVPQNGSPEFVLGSQIAEDPDGVGDATNVVLSDQIASGEYFIRAMMETLSGTVFSRSIPVRVFAEAFPGEDADVEAVGGSSYEVFGVDLARDDGVFTWRVRTNYDPLASGGDIYVNVGGSFTEGGGTLSAIAVRDRTTETGQSVTAGQVLRDVDFRGGTIRQHNPIYAMSYSSSLTGIASVEVTSTPDRPWRYEINGVIPLAAIGADQGDSVEFGWGMYCGNDFSATDNDKSRINLRGAGLELSGLTENTAQPSSRRWGDEVTLRFSVVNQGNAEAGESAVQFVISSDETIELDDLAIAAQSGQHTIPALGPGEIHQGEITFLLPESPPAGFEATGDIYVGMISDAANTVSESNEDDNRNLGIGTDIALLRIGREKYVNVLIHGYDPNPFSYESMWRTWRSFADGLEAFAESSNVDELTGNVGTHVTQWRSSEGWHSAFIDVIGYAAIEVVKPRNPLLAFAAEQLQEMFLADARNSMVRAERFARAAATMTVRDLLSPREGGEASLLGTPTEDQWIHVIGHSRGGAVGAEVVRQLGALGYNVDWYTALDGYSTDWPAPSNILADIDIVNTVSAFPADSQINYRVQQGLAAIASSVAEDFVESQLEWLLGSSIDIGFTEAFVNRYADWRAPDRVGFVDPVISFAGGLSNHVTISPSYFDRSFRPAYNPYDVLMDAATAAVTTTAATQFVEASVLSTSNAAANDTVLASGLHDFADGGFERVGHVRSLLAQLESIPSFEDELTDTLLRVISLPGFGINTSLDVTGMYEIIQESGNSVLQLKQTNDTSFADLVELPVNAAELRFRYAAMDAGPGDELVVSFNGETLSQYPLSAVSTTEFQEEVVDIRAYAGRIGEFQFSLSGPVSTPAILRLDDLAVMNAMPEVSISDAPAVVEGGGAVFAVNLSAPAPAGGVTITFSTSDLTATANIDYVPQIEQRITVPEGQTAASIVVDTLRDSLAEQDETLMVSLIDVTGAVISNASATGTIIDATEVEPHFDFDIDGNGVRNPFQDATLLFAWMSPGTPDSVYTALIGNNSSRSTPAAIKSLLDANSELFDLDGNGSLNPFKDAVLLFAWMSPGTPDSVWESFIGTDAAPSRSTPAAIKDYLDGLQNRSETQSFTFAFAEVSDDEETLLFQSAPVRAAFDLPDGQFNALDTLYSASENGAVPWMALLDL